MSTIDWKFFNTDYKLQIELGFYPEGGVALGFYDTADGELFSVATTWLEELGPGLAYLDTNNFPDIEKIFKEYKLGEPTNIKKSSGFVEYPLYHLDLDQIGNFIFLNK